MARQVWTSDSNAAMDSPAFSLPTNIQFFLPMVLHRMIGRRGISAALEGLCRGLGLTRLWGSPVIALFVPDTRR